MHFVLLRWRGRVASDGRTGALDDTTYHPRATAGLKNPKLFVAGSLLDLSLPFGASHVT